MLLSVRCRELLIILSIAVERRNKYLNVSFRNKYY